MILATVILSVSGIHAAETTQEDLLRQGLFEEEANHDFDKAAERYRAVVAAHDKQRALAATATFRLGEIARKKNDKEAAAAAFRTVVGRFPEQTDLARISQENLAALGMAAPNSPTTTPVAEVPQQDSEDKEIERLKNLARSSPDLIDGASETGWRPLHLAAANGQMKVMTYLLGNKVDVNCRTIPEQLTPLHLASVNGHLAAVGALLAAGAKIDEFTDNSQGYDKKLPPHDKRGGDFIGKWTALDLAVLYDRREVARALIKAGADLRRAGPYISGNLTSLMEALYLGRDEIARALIEAGAPLGATEGDDADSPLAIAIRESPSLVTTLLQQGADPNLPFEADRTTPLQRAVQEGRLDLVKLLIDSGANVKATNEPKKTALHFAAAPEMVDFLISKGADPNARDNEGLTPLDAVARGKNSTATVAAFEVLLAKGAVVEDPEVLLKRTSPDMQQVVRERVAYPLAQSADNVLLSVRCYAADGPQWIMPLDIRPAPGSPPPSILEALTMTPNSGVYSSLGDLKVVRRDEEGRFRVVFDWTPRQKDGLNIEFPLLQWGDILELSLTNISGMPRLGDFSGSLADRTITVKLGGVSSSHKFIHSFGLLGDSAAYFSKTAVVSGPRPRLGRQSGYVAPNGNSSLSDFDLIPDFVDSSTISVTRKGVEKPILVNLEAKNKPPFRLIEGDVMDLVMKESVCEDLRTNNKQLILTTDFTLGKVVDHGGLFASVALFKSRQVNDQYFDFTDVRVLRKGNEKDVEHVDFSKIIPADFNEGRDNPPHATFLKAEPLQAGDWIFVSRLPPEADEKAKESAEKLLNNIWIVAANESIMESQPKPEPKLIPPPSH